MEPHQRGDHRPEGPLGNAPLPHGAAWPVAHPVAGSLAWSAALIAVFAPLAVRHCARGER